jgi:hypothetical protein
MSYRIAGIDVHKKMLAVVVSDVEIDGEHQFERRMFGSNPEQLRSLAAWLPEQEAEEVVMESTAQYWKPVWEAGLACHSRLVSAPGVTVRSKYLFAPTRALGPRNLPPFAGFRIRYLESTLTRNIGGYRVMVN